MTTLNGQGVSRGTALGKVAFYRRSGQEIEPSAISDVPAELERFEKACGQAVEELEQLYAETLSTLGEENALLFQIHEMMLEDPDFTDAVRARIEGECLCAEYAVDAAAKEAAAAFAAMDDEYMQARSADVLDVGRRLVRILTHTDEGALFGSEPVVVAADDLAPSETARLDRSKVLAFLTSGGSANSHTAIFARTMGIPAVVGLGEALGPELDGREAAVDGGRGLVVLDPDEAVRTEFAALKADEDAGRARTGRYRGKASVTRDGRRVELCANVGGPQDVALALEGDAEGIGLFRSEFLYLQSRDYPDEETQFAAYRDVLERMEGKRVVIRTLDIGADKQAEYFHLPQEENPAMGMRAIRICLTRPEVFCTQLRALYRASAHGKLAVMFPMITSVDEVRRIKLLCAQVREELQAAGEPFDEHMELGIMVETPAAAVISDLLAQEVDFFSIGTNDLTQYTLAVDRQNAAIESFCDRHHEAVIRLIRTTVKNAHAAGIWVGICGELAADTALTETFMEIGVDELSMTPGNILEVKAKILDR